MFAPHFPVGHSMWVKMLLLRENPASAFLFQTTSRSVFTKIPRGQDAYLDQVTLAGCGKSIPPAPPKDEAGWLRGVWEFCTVQASLVSSSCCLDPEAVTVLCWGQSQGSLPSFSDFPQPCPAFVNSPWMRFLPISVSVCRTWSHIARHVKHHVK